MNATRRPPTATGVRRCGGWIRNSLASGRVALLDQVMPEFETILHRTALEFTGGRKQDAARLLGWGAIP